MLSQSWWAYVVGSARKVAGRGGRRGAVAAAEPESDVGRNSSATSPAADRASGAASAGWTMVAEIRVVSLAHVPVGASAGALAETFVGGCSAAFEAERYSYPASMAAAYKATTARVEG